MNPITGVMKNEGASRAQKWQIIESEDTGRLERVLEERGVQLNMGIDKRLCITVPEAAEMPGISRNFGYKLVKEGKLPSQRFGKRILMPRAALDRMLEEGMTQCKG